MPVIVNKFNDMALKMGNIKIEPPVILAPMAGVTDFPFRLLARQAGCGLVCSEMISAKGLVYGNETTRAMIRIDDLERPVSLQIFGSDPAVMSAAAALVAEVRPDIIDINMGCPMPKIVNNGDGAALMRDPMLAEQVMRAVVKAVKIPVTIKIRSGWDESSINAVDIAKRAEAAGVVAVIIHGRTRSQLYTGKADWKIISAIKATVSIPVIGNGDIRTAVEARQRLTETGCDGIMIGRAAQGNLWIFSQIKDLLAGSTNINLPSVIERRLMLLAHLDMLIELKGEHIAVREMRCHAVFYTKGLRGAAAIRQKINSAQTRQQFAELLAQ